MRHRLLLLLLVAVVGIRRQQFERQALLTQNPAQRLILLPPTTVNFNFLPCALPQERLDNVEQRSKPSRRVDQQGLVRSTGIMMTHGANDVLDETHNFGILECGEGDAGEIQYTGHDGVFRFLVTLDVVIGV